MGFYQNIRSPSEVILVPSLHHGIRYTSANAVGVKHSPLPK
jgi:hypothetical protein